MKNPFQKQPKNYTSELLHEIIHLLIILTIIIIFSGIFITSTFEFAIDTFLSVLDDRNEKLQINFIQK